MYNRILLPIDLNHKASWSKSLPTALQLCRDYSASLHVVMVIPDFGLPLVGGFFPKEYAAKAKQAITDNLREFVKANVPKDIKVQRVVADLTNHPGSISKRPWPSGVRAEASLTSSPSMVRG